MNYKKKIKSQSLRIKILKLLSFVPDKIMVKIQFRISTGKKLNLKHPITFNEKIQLYKLNYRNHLMVLCADKYAVRTYVKNKGLSNILNDLYSVYSSYKDIDFKILPEKFVIKTTNGSGTNYFCLNKNNIDFKELEIQLNKWMKPIKKSPGREWVYEKIAPKIICEKYLEVEKGEDLRDYKFFCFDGEPKYIQVDLNRSTNHKRNIYDIDWNFIDESITYPNVGDIIQKPNNFNEMLEISRILSKDFPHVRVDLYDFKGEVVFGELTFFHGSGYEKFSSYEFEKDMGNEFIVPNQKFS